MNNDKINEILEDYSAQTPMQEYLVSVIDKMDGIDMMDPPIPTGFYDLDYYLDGGLHHRQLITGGARPSVGKTSFAISLIHNMLEKNKKILFFSLEMSSQDVIKRLFAGITGMSLYKITSRVFSDTEINAIQSAADYIYSKTFYIVDIPRLSIESLKIMAKEAVLRKKIDCIIIDSFNLIECREDSSADRYSRIAKVLKDLNYLEVPIVTMLQCPRDREHREPYLADVPSDMYPLINESDVVFFLHRSRYVTESNQYSYDDEIARKAQKVKVLIEKNINGDNGLFYFYFNGDTSAFDNYF